MQNGAYITSSEKTCAAREGEMGDRVQLKISFPSHAKGRMLFNFSNGWGGRELRIHHTDI